MLYSSLFKNEKTEFKGNGCHGDYAVGKSELKSEEKALGNELKENLIANGKKGSKKQEGEEKSGGLGHFEAVEKDTGDGKALKKVKDAKIVFSRITEKIIDLEVELLTLKYELLELQAILE